MVRWIFGSKKRAGGKTPHHPKSGGARGRGAARKARAGRRDQPAPLTWNNPEQDFITRYGDPFDD
jgi:hypothetical protein